MHGNAHGPTVDPLDELCRYYTQSIACLKAEFGDTCDPWTEVYDSPLEEPGYDPSDPLPDEFLKFGCQLINSLADDCARATCAVAAVVTATAPFLVTWSAVETPLISYPLT